MTTEEFVVKNCGCVKQRNTCFRLSVSVEYGRVIENIDRLKDLQSAHLEKEGER